MSTAEPRRPIEGTPPPRRAGLRPEERDPDERPGPPGSAGGGVNMSGAPGGGGAAGGMAGTNAGDGSADDLDVDLNDVLGDEMYDNLGSVEDGGPPYGGPSGGAVGGTPAEKRAAGGRIRGGLAPQGDIGDDRTLGTDPDLHETSTEEGSAEPEED